VKGVVFKSYDLKEGIDTDQDGDVTRKEVWVAAWSSFISARTKVQERSSFRRGPVPVTRTTTTPEGPRAVHV